MISLGLSLRFKTSHRIIFLNVHFLEFVEPCIASYVCIFVEYVCRVRFPSVCIELLIILHSIMKNFCAPYRHALSWSTKNPNFRTSDIKFFIARHRACLGFVICYLLYNSILTNFLAFCTFQPISACSAVTKVDIKNPTNQL